MFQNITQVIRSTLAIHGVNNWYLFVNSINCMSGAAQRILEEQEAAKVGLGQPARDQYLMWVWYVCKLFANIEVMKIRCWYVESEWNFLKCLFLQCKKYKQWDKFPCLCWCRRSTRRWTHGLIFYTIMTRCGILKPTDLILQTVQLFYLRTCGTDLYFDGLPFTALRSGFPLTGAFVYLLWYRIPRLLLHLPSERP